MELTGSRVLVTGATGLIGDRLVERLTKMPGVTVRILARDPVKARRFECYGLEIIIGDITDADCVSRAVEGCNMVFHSVMARGDADNRMVNVEGTRYVMQAAKANRIRRVVHVSSCAVYRPESEGVFDERCPRIPDGTGTSYHDTKLESEELVLRYDREEGVPAVVIQPVAVYGPRGGDWTIRILRQLKDNIVILVDGNSASHNFVYVDDVAQAMVLAAIQDNVEGESFLIGGSQAILYKDFYAAYEAMLGIRATATVSQAELDDQGDPAVIVRQCGLPADKPVVTEAVTSHFFSIDKARHMLKYEPQFSFERGMKLTEQWVKSEARKLGLC